ncbi:MFS transporter [Cryobacterium sp. Y82]|uniref:MFS transporter n=1 Tax=Cryobacterium sp. Y82 TaxID=2045017 RepID=UPI0018EC3B2A|nr:MFS transporter [Cryobacterium sp. Y82]
MSQSSTALREGLGTKSNPVRAVVAGSFGNLMENYDNLVYAYSAFWISQLFFPAAEGASGILLTFAVFAVGFFARPLGTLFFGHYGDKAGRKAALVVSVALMGVTTVLMGFLPTYSSIGIAAPILLVVLRLLQGFAVAGEWAGSAAMLVEYAPANRRGFFGSFNQVSTGAGFLLAAAVVTLNASIFDEATMLEWAWRVPFFLGAITAIAALILRMGLDDTPHFRKEVAAGTVAKRPVLVALQTQFPAILKGFGFTVVWTVGYFFFLTYIPTYLTQVAGVDANVAKTSNLLALVVFTLSIPVFGLLSDKIGRRPLLLAGAAGFVVSSFPILAIFNSGNDAAVYFGQILLALILAAFSGPGPAALSELFPTNVRYSALGIGYNFSVMAFGGTAAFMATGVVKLTGSPITAAIIPTGAAVVTLLVILFLMPESAKSKLK